MRTDRAIAIFSYYNWRRPYQPFLSILFVRCPLMTFRTFPGCCWYLSCSCSGPLSFWDMFKSFQSFLGHTYFFLTQIGKIWNLLGAYPSASSPVITVRLGVISPDLKFSDDLFAHAISAHDRKRFSLRLGILKLILHLMCTAARQMPMETRVELPLCPVGTRW